MSSPFDETDFIDRDFQQSRAPAGSTHQPPGASPGSAMPRPPTREELEARVGETQQRIAELRRAQEELERERATLEEARRRRTELETGRHEMVEHLTRGAGLIERSEFEARRDADQLAKTLAGFRDALEAIQAIKEQTWTQENWNVELTRALTAIENARMEWNSARLKWPVLDGTSVAPTGAAQPTTPPPANLADRRFADLCRLGFALTWPVALAVLLCGLGLALMLLRR